MIFRRKAEDPVDDEQKTKDEEERDKEYAEAHARKRALDIQLWLIELRRSIWKRS